MYTHNLCACAALRHKGRQQCRQTETPPAAAANCAAAFGRARPLPPDAGRGRDNPRQQQRLFPLGAKSDKCPARVTTDAAASDDRSPWAGGRRWGQNRPIKSPPIAADD
ncbi:hypothetical protein niasHS_006303 [Heterodera schachtii]|uniref:Uncharacterized protein n=1 Tax=Heterodera schachtii TaxID=97005 RepID=A0ABD2JSZ4_HETSC